MAKPLPAPMAPGHMEPGARQLPAPADCDPERHIVCFCRVLTLCTETVAPACFFRKKQKKKQKAGREETPPAALWPLWPLRRARPSARDRPPPPGHLAQPPAEPMLPSQPGGLRRRPVAECVKATVPEGPEATRPHPEAGRPSLGSGGGLGQTCVLSSGLHTCFLPLGGTAEDQAPSRHVRGQDPEPALGAPQPAPPGGAQGWGPGCPFPARWWQRRGPLGETPLQSKMSSFGKMGGRASGHLYQSWRPGKGPGGSQAYMACQGASAQPGASLFQGWPCMFPLVISSSDSCS